MYFELFYFVVRCEVLNYFISHALKLQLECVRRRLHFNAVLASTLDAESASFQVVIPSMAKTPPSQAPRSACP
jgi:hypothetical protein